MFRMVLDLQEKNREVSTENSQVPCTHCPLLLTTYISMGCYLQLVSQFWCIVINWSPRFIQISLVLTVTFFMCSRMPSRRSHYISLSCVLKLLLAVTVSQTSLVSDDFCFKRYRYLVGCPSLGTWCFSRDWTRFMVLGVEGHYFYPVMARTQTAWFMIAECELDRLAEVVCPFSLLWAYSHFSKTGSPQVTAVCFRSPVTRA